MAKHDIIALGDLVKDTITGVKGIVVCISKWLNGCETISIQQRELHDKKPQERLAFDAEQLEIISPVVKERALKRTGGNPIAAKTGRE